MKKIFIACAILLIVGLTGVYFFFDFIQRETTKGQEQANLEIKKEETSFKSANEDLIRIIYTTVPLSEYQEKKARLGNKMTAELVAELFPEDPFEEAESDVMNEVASVLEVTTIRLKNIDESHRQTTTYAKVLTQGGQKIDISVVAKYQKNDELWLMRGLTPVENSSGEVGKSRSSESSSTK